MIFYISLFIMTFLFMEFTANMAHRYLMHGLMWYFHSDHHKKEAGFFEKNDIFFLIFAIPAMILTMGGFFLENYYSLAVGLGITAYGFAYFWVHEVYIHRRLKLFDNVDNFYFQALNRAHKDHHSQLEKEDAQNFGMLWVPLKYFKNANN